MFVIIDYSYFAPVLTLVGLKLDRLIQFRFWLRPTSTLVEAGEIDPGAIQTISFAAADVENQSPSGEALEPYSIQIDDVRFYTQ